MNFDADKLIETTDRIEWKHLAMAALGAQTFSRSEQKARFPARWLEHAISLGSDRPL